MPTLHTCGIAVHARTRGSVSASTSATTMAGTALSSGAGQLTEDARRQRQDRQQQVEQQGGAQQRASGGLIRLESVNAAADQPANQRQIEQGSGERAPLGQRAADRAGENASSAQRWTSA